ncbi:TauD/TfdA family dioxygenase [Bradyrhizobium sp. CNPSo 4010]|uniref:TauD/TfdA family dioxygenase n=1 Tax=Bradyrhizobium agreste TaxID=2751811 RepID=A0ABS0PGZ3_9BRAD|nr:TauD/TfdA family dioxygenase [Bradyrhizobium agreste]MBH5396266.1 TauD/TfdA family dioxygenase [Bradyrhizobium agreste]
MIDPADWRGPEVKNSRDWVYQIDEADIADIEAALAHVERNVPNLVSMTRDEFPLKVFGGKLKAVKRQLNDGLGFVLVRGLPIDRYSREQVAAIYLGIGLHLGKPVPQNGKGHLLGHIINLGSSMANPNQRGHESKETLRYHTDECDVVGLLCLHEAKAGGASTLASAVAIHNAIQAERPDLLQVLYQPWYIDRRGEIPEGLKPWYTMPIFTYHEGRLMVWLEPGYSASAQRFPEVPRYTDAQLEAMRLVETLAHDPRFRLDMTFGKGDIQFLNNHVILHSRTEYEDYPELERRRHLLRLWLTSEDTRALSPWHTARHAPGSRGGVYLKGIAPNIAINPV